MIVFNQDIYAPIFYCDLPITGCRDLKIAGRHFKSYQSYYLLCSEDDFEKVRSAYDNEHKFVIIEKAGKTILATLGN